MACSAISSAMKIEFNKFYKSQNKQNSRDDKNMIEENVIDHEFQL